METELTNSARGGYVGVLIIVGKEDFFHCPFFARIIDEKTLSDSFLPKVMADYGCGEGWWGQGYYRPVTDQEFVWLRSMMFQRQQVYVVSVIAERATDAEPPFGVYFFLTSLKPHEWKRVGRARGRRKGRRHFPKPQGWGRLHTSLFPLAEELVLTI